MIVVYPLVLPQPPPLKGVGGTRALPHFIVLSYVLKKIGYLLVHIFIIQILGKLASNSLPKEIVICLVGFMHELKFY